MTYFNIRDVRLFKPHINPPNVDSIAIHRRYFGLPLSILTATAEIPGLSRRSIAVPLATCPKAPLPITFSMVTLSREISQERVDG